MSETLTAYLISIVILAALALLVPCIELLARLLRRGRRKTDAAPLRQPVESRRRNVA